MIDGFDSSSGMCTCSSLVSNTNPLGHLIFNGEGEYTIYINDKTGYADTTSVDVNARNTNPTTYTYSFKITQHEDKERTGRVVCIEMYIGEDKVENFSITSDYISYLLKDIHQVNRFIEEEHEEDVLSKYYNPLRDEIINKRMPLYVEFLKSQKCVMVEEQRLKTTTGSRYQVTQKTVEDIQKKIELFFASAQKKYNQESLKIDGSFIKRLSDLQEKND